MLDSVSPHISPTARLALALLPGHAPICLSIAPSLRTMLPCIKRYQICIPHHRIDWKQGCMLACALWLAKELPYYHGLTEHK